MDTNELDHQHKTLFFIEGSLPSDAEVETAKGLKGQVAFRNALLVPDDGPIEHADAVAGRVPERYKVAYAAKPEIDRDREKAADGTDKAWLANDFERGRPGLANNGRNPNLPRDMPTVESASGKNKDKDTKPANDGWKGASGVQPGQYDPTKAPADLHAGPVEPSKPAGATTPGATPAKPMGAAPNAEDAAAAERARAKAAAQAQNK